MKRKTHPAVYICGIDDRELPDNSDCRRNDLHTPMPRGYIEASNWAEEKLKTHVTQRCPGCGLWKVWVPREEGYDGDEIIAGPPPEPVTLTIQPSPIQLPPRREVVTHHRCRRRYAASTLRCMGEVDHGGEHWCWKADVWQSWPDRDCAEVQA